MIKFRMRKPVSIISAIIIVVGLSSIWFFRERVFTETRFLMDTVCEIKVAARVKPTKAIKEAFEAMKEIDSLASFAGTGDIARINDGEDFNLSPHILKIIDKGIQIGDLTQGAFDISIRPLMEVWGDFKIEEIPEDQTIKNALKLVNYKDVKLKDKKLELNSGMKLDLSGIAKGYAVDRAIEVLKEYGVKTALVNAGGDIRVMGERIWKIGIKNPRGAGIVKTLSLKNESVATSGDYEKYFIKNGIRYHHILDPKIGYPARKCVSVTISTDKCNFADALATGVFILGPEKGEALLESLGIKGVIIQEKEGELILTEIGM
jgi:thiamine biosynthesis lipoprotein